MAASLRPAKPPAYRVVNAPGGHYKIYPNGQRTFVAHGTGTGQGVGQVTVDPRHPPRDQIVTGTGTGQGTGQVTGRGTTRPPTVRASGPGIGTTHPIFPPPVRPPEPGAGTPSPNPPPAPQGAADFQGDADYYAALGQAQFKAGQQRADLDQQSAYAKTDFDEALRRMLERQPRDIQAAREVANRAGLLYSGNLGRQEGDINTTYLRQQSDAQQSYDRAEAAREAARRALEAGLSVDDAALQAAAVDRRVARDTGKADAGLLAPAAPATSKPAAATAPTKPPRTGSLGAVTQGPTRGPRVGGRSTSFRGGQGFGEITVGPAKGGGRKKGGRSRRRKGSGGTVTLTGSFAGAGGGIP